MAYYFFKKSGRISKLEQQGCVKIVKFMDEHNLRKTSVNRFLKSNKTPSNLPELEQLYDYLSEEVTFKNNPDSSVSNKKNDTVDYKEQIEESENIEQEEEENEQQGDGYNEQVEEKPREQVFENRQKMDNVEFNPFEEKVKEREYTKGVVSDVDETLYEDNDVDNFDDPNDFSSHQNYEEDIPEVEFSESTDDNYEDFGNDPTSSEEDFGGKEKLASGNLEDLSPAEKRKAAKKTAEAFLGVYAKVVPQPFIHWATISDKKINELAKNKLIDLSMELDNDMTIKSYVDTTNSAVRDVFEVKPEDLDEIREPLIEVLLEQELALTPTQRLLMAVGMHVGTMGFKAYQLSQNNKMALETFKQFQAERISAMQGFQAPPMMANEPKQTPPTPQAPYQSQSTNTKTKEEPIQSYSTIDIDEMSANDRKYAQSIIDIIDAEHDPNITVENTLED